jgi:anti-sigma factor ChrR (cupin superfamily)
MKDCLRTEDLLRYLDGTNPAEAEHVKKHLASCPRCKRELAQLQAVAYVMAADAAQKRPLPGKGCPDDEALAAFIEGSLPEKEKKSVAGHVAGCRACIIMINEIKRIDELPDPVVPAELDRAMEDILNRKLGFKRKETMLEVVVQWVKQGIALVSKLPEGLTLLAPEPVLVRGQAQKTTRTIALKYMADEVPLLVTLTKSVSYSQGGLRVELERPADNVTVSLFKNDSKKTGTKPVRFKNPVSFKIPYPDEYLLLVFRNHRESGQLRISLVK